MYRLSDIFWIKIRIKYLLNTDVVDVIKIIRAQVARLVEVELNAEAITTLVGEREEKSKIEREREKELVLRRCLIM